MEVAGMVVAEVVAFTAAVAEVVAFTAAAVEVVAFTAAVAAVTLAAEHPDPALEEVHVPVDQELFAALLLAPMAPTGQAGPELTAIEHTVRDLMGCTVVAEARLRQALVTARCRGTGLIQG
jgi:hypothetical protein